MNQQNTVRFQNITGLSKVIIMLFRVQIVAVVIYPVLFVLFSFLEAINFHNPSQLNEVFMTIVALPASISRLILTLTFTLLVILIPIWFYQAYNNLIPLKAYKKTYPSFWAAICWFVPIIELFRPIQIARELWIESDPDFEPGLDFMPKAAHAPGFATNWWLFFIMSYILMCIVPVAVLLFWLATRDAIELIKTINERQNNRFQKLQQFYSADSL